MPRKRTEQNANSDVIRFKPRTKAQSEVFDIYKDNNILFLIGAAGTGKTHIAVYLAIHDMFSRVKLRRVDNIFLTRPVVEAGERLGYLPGDMEEKVYPYTLPVQDCLVRFVHDPEEFMAQHFELTPLAYLRGRTLDNCVAILDEAQNCTEAQLKLFITRMGENCKLIITGDPTQSDIGQCSLLKVVDSIRQIPGIGVCEFTEDDIVRNPLITQVLKAWPK